MALLVGVGAEEITETLIDLFSKHRDELNLLVRPFSDQNITFWRGIQKTLPSGKFPSIEFQVNNDSTSWVATPAQQVQFNYTITVTIMIPPSDKEMLQNSERYITRLAKAIRVLLNSPKHLQLEVIGATKQDQNLGYTKAYFLDSLVESIDYGDAQEGTIRIARLSWRCDIFQTFHQWLYDHVVEIKPKPPIEP